MFENFDIAFEKSDTTIETHAIEIHFTALAVYLRAYRDDTGTISHVYVGHRHGCGIYRHEY